MTFYAGRLALFAAAIALPASTLMAQNAQAPSTAVQTIVRQASDLDDQGRHDLAADNWRKVLLIDPKQPDALAALARYSKARGDQAASDAYLARLRAINPHDSRIATVQSTTLAVDHSGDLDEAARLASQHKYEEALALYRRAFGSSKPPANLALVYYETEAAVPSELPQAIKGLRELQHGNPANPVYQLALGRVLTYQPATRLEGVELLSKVNGLPEYQEQARVAWRQALLWDTGSAAARQTGEQYLRRYPDPDLAARLQSGVAQREEIATRTGTSPVEGEAYAALDKGSVKEAEHLFTTMVDEPRQRAKGEIGLGYVKMREQNFDEAVRHFEAGIAAGAGGSSVNKALQDARFWRTMAAGNTAMSHDDDAAAIADFKQALALRQNSPEAAQALAGVFAKEQRPQDALPLFQQALQQAPTRLDSWTNWFRALMQAGRPQQVISEQARISADMRVRLENDPNYLSVLAEAESAIGNQAAANMTLDRMLRLPSADINIKTAALLQSADQMMSTGRPQQAIPLCMTAIRVQQTSSKAWQTLIRAENAAGKTAVAIEFAERMPRNVYEASMKDTAFLLTLAQVYQADHQLDQAASLLERVRSQAESSQFPLSARLQLASLALDQKNPSLAYSLYRQIAAESPNSVEAWTGLLSSLHEAQQDREALKIMGQLPTDVIWKLQNDSSALLVTASIDRGAGQNRQAMEALRRLMIHYHDQQQPVPYDVKMELAWLYLDSNSDVELSNTLTSLASQPDLSAAQKTEVANLWASWSMRRSEVELQQGHGQQGVAMLEVALRAYPNNTGLRRALANAYIRVGNPNLALSYYEQLDWRTAEQADYAVAISAAAAAHKVKEAYTWLNAGLQRWPNDHQLLTLGAQISEKNGDRKRAETYFRAELGQPQTLTPAQQQYSIAQGTTQATASSTAAADLAVLLAPQGISPAAPAPSNNALIAASRQPDSDVASLFGALSSDGTRSPDGQLAAFNVPAAASQTIATPDKVFAASAHPQEMAPAVPVTGNLATYHAPAGDAVASAAPQVEYSMPAPSPTAVQLPSRIPAPAAADSDSRGGRTVASPISWSPDGTGPGPGPQFGNSNPQEPQQQTQASVTVPALPLNLPPAAAMTAPVSAPMELPSLNSYNTGAIASSPVADPPALRGVPASLPTQPSPSDAALGSMLAPVPPMLYGSNPASLTNSSTLSTPAPTILTSQPESVVTPAPVIVPQPAAAPYSQPLPMGTNAVILTPRPNKDAADLDAMEASYSPWAGVDSSVASRTGTIGYDRLSSFGIATEASTVLGGSARLSIITRPVLLEAGAPDGTSTYNYGTATPAQAAGTDHSASGVGGEVELTSRTFDAALGYTPSGFLVSNVIGGLAFHPQSSPVSVRLYREGIHETLLSYAGATDPVTGKVWGGVIATGGEAHLGVGNATSGFYAAIGGAQLTGLNVTENNRVNGNAGAYWWLYGNEYGMLQVGVNISGEHFANNQRYFSYGQGGYFSPKAYLLANVPFTWKSKVRNGFSYKLTASLGAQTFQDSTAVAGSVVGTLPTDQSVSGGNYSVSARGAYMMNPHWFVGAFANADNAHDYTSRGAGFYVKYMFKPQTQTEQGPTGLFDDEVQRPLIVP